MASLQIAANYTTTMGDVGFHYGHLQIVHDGFEIEVQAPISAEFWGDAPFFGYAGVRNHTDPEHTEYALLSEEGDAQRYEIMDIDVGDRNPDMVWELLTNIHLQFFDQRPHFLYALGQNSNSYASTLLWMVGIDVSAYIPELTLTSAASDIIGPGLVGEALTIAALTYFGGDPTDGDLEQLFPGADRNIFTDGYGTLGSLEFGLYLYGTVDGDFLRTGNGENTLVGGEGDDTINGGDGNDIIVGDQGSDVLFGGDGHDVLDYSGNIDGADASGSDIQATLF